MGKDTKYEIYQNEKSKTLLSENQEQYKLKTS